MEDIVSKRSAIEIKVGLNANNLPLEMHWSASDGQIENASAKAMFLSFWNPDETILSPNIINHG